MEGAPCPPPSSSGTQATGRDTDGASRGLPRGPVAFVILLCEWQMPVTIPLLNSSLKDQGHKGPEALPAATCPKLRSSNSPAPMRTAAFS